VWESHRRSSKSPGVTDKQFGAMTDPKCDARVNVGGTRGYVVRNLVGIRCLIYIGRGWDTICAVKGLVTAKAVVRDEGSRA
jgi:hypothetical protein